MLTKQLYSIFLLTFCIQEFGDSQLRMCDIKCIVQVPHVVFWIEALVSDQVWAMGMNEGIESQTVSP